MEYKTLIILIAFFVVWKNSTEPAILCFSVEIAKVFEKLTAFICEKREILFPLAFLQRQKH